MLFRTMYIYISCLQLQLLEYLGNVHVIDVYIKPLDTCVMLLVINVVTNSA